jgi:hypothetical protein
MIDDRVAENKPQLSEPSLSSSLGGIINDLQVLAKQEIALARRELLDELHKARQAAISLGIGLGVTALGALLLVLMLVFLLNWAVAAIPLWGAFGIVGILLLALGGMLLLHAKNKAEDIHVVPEQTAETMKENLQWIKKQTS